MRTLLTALLFTLCTPAWALSGLSIEAGHGSRANITRVSSLWQLDQRWPGHAGWHVASQIHAGLGAWNGTGTNSQTVAEAFITPTLRYRPDASSGQQPYLETGIGAHIVSATRLDDQHALGAHLLLSEHLGMGVVFGGRSQYDLGYRFQRINNAGLSAHHLRLLFNY
jgi:lipid A 3-O-deacylase